MALSQLFDHAHIIAPLSLFFLSELISLHISWAIATWIYSVYGFREGMRMLRFNKRRQVEVTLPS